VIGIVPGLDACDGLKTGEGGAVEARGVDLTCGDILSSPLGPVVSRGPDP
jgi:hypothetical protein